MTAKEMHELAMENSGYKEEFNLILEQIKEQAEAGCFRLVVDDISYEVVSMLKELGYMISWLKNDDTLIRW